jgi:hypothetical protein
LFGSRGVIDEKGCPGKQNKDYDNDGNALIANPGSAPAGTIGSCGHGHLMGSASFGGLDLLCAVNSKAQLYP